MPQCAVSTCRNSHRRTRGMEVRYHRFPQTLEVRERWVLACGREPLPNGEVGFNIQTARVCSWHFPLEAYEKDVEHEVLGLPLRSRLRRGAVPILQVPVAVEPVSELVLETAKRSLLKALSSTAANSESSVLQGDQAAQASSSKAKTRPATAKSTRLPSTSKAAAPKPSTSRAPTLTVNPRSLRRFAGGKCTRKVNDEKKKQPVQRRCAPIPMELDNEEPVPLDPAMKAIEVLTAVGLVRNSLNKMHAMEVGGEEASTSMQNGAALPEESSVEQLPVSIVLKKEAHSDSESDVKPPVHPMELSDLGSEPSYSSEPSEGSVSKGTTTSRKVVKCDTIAKKTRKRRSEGDLGLNGGCSMVKKFRSAKREDFITTLVGNDTSVSGISARARRLREDCANLEELAQFKEREWNELLTLRKATEEAYLRVIRRGRILDYMAGTDGEPIPSTSTMPAAYDICDNVAGPSSAPGKDKRTLALCTVPNEERQSTSRDSSPAFKLNAKSAKRQASATPPLRQFAAENGRNQANSQSPENRQIGEGRQGRTVNVKSLIADFRLQHPEVVPKRRGRRIRNAVTNIGLGTGGGVVETGQVVADSRPSSSDSSGNANNSADPNLSYKDVLVKFAKLSQQQGEPIKTPQNFPDVTLHPVTPTTVPQSSSSSPQQQSSSLLHGILTKSQSPRPTSLAPTLARLLTAPERERHAAAASGSAQHAPLDPQQILQSFQETTVNIRDLLSSSKARTEITITPVINNVQLNLECSEDESPIAEERDFRTDREYRESPPLCQGCHNSPAQFVCAGCGNQWYCSRECQVGAWDVHSEVCSG